MQTEKSKTIFPYLYICFFFIKAEMTVKLAARTRTGTNFLK